MKISINRFTVVIATILGAIYAFTLFEPSFILGRSVYWTEPFGDRITNLIGALYFAHDDWRFPLFYVPGLGFPEGANIVYTDSLPLLALVAKVIFKMTGEWVNYFGLWLFACFPLLAFFIALATKEGGAKDVVSVLGATFLALASPALLIRFGHAALMAHFLIAWSFYLYLKLIRSTDSRAVIAQFCVVAALSVVLQAYFLMMVLPFLLAALAQVVMLGRVTLRNAIVSFIAVIGVILATAWIAGIIGSGSIPADAWGFGHYSMNVLSPFLPPREWLPENIARHITWDGNGYSWDATGGQYEGYNYLGAGMLLLLIVHLSTSRDLVKKALKRHVFLVLVLTGLLLFALSNRVFVGDWLVFDIPMFPFLRIITDHFRTGGRLFWPIYYVLTVALVLLTYQRFNPRIAKALIITAVFLQLADTQHLRNNMVANVGHGFAQELPQEAWKPLLEAHQFLKQYPSFQCGGWAGKWPENNSNMELLWLTAQLGKPSSSAYLARSNRNCADEIAEGEKFDIREEGLYIFGDKFPIQAIEDLPNFRDWCREFAHGVACSRNWAKLPQLAVQPEFRPISGSREWIPEYRFGEVLRFSAGGNGRPFLLRGWSIPESWGTWSLGEQSEVALRLAEPLGKEIRLRVKANPFVHPGRPVKEIAVFVNDKQVAMWSYKLGEGMENRTANIPTNIYQRRDGVLRIKFVSKTVESPKQAGLSADTRPVSLGLVELALTAD